MVKKENIKKKLNYFTYFNRNLDVHLDENYGIHDQMFIQKNFL